MKDPVAGIRRKSRMVVEIRYPAMPTIFDRRGAIISQIHPEVKDRMPQWEVKTGTILFRNDEKNPTQELVVSLKKALVAIEDPGTAQEFVDRGRQYLGLIHDAAGGELKQLTRIGVRLIEVLQPDGGCTFDDARDRVESRFITFPADLELAAKDVAIVVEHGNGRLQVGPVKEGEGILQRLFKDIRHIPKCGVMVDIDSFETDVAIGRKGDLSAAFLATYRLSKAVEESLARHIGWVEDSRE